MNWVRAFKNKVALPFEWRLWGYEIIDSQEKFVAPVLDLLVEKETGRVRYILAEIGGLLSIKGRMVVIPDCILTRAGSGQAVASATLEYIQDSPLIDDPDNITREEEEALYSHYGYKPYWEQVGALPDEDTEEEKQEDESGRTDD